MNGMQRSLRRAHRIELPKLFRKLSRYERLARKIGADANRDEDEVMRRLAKQGGRQQSETELFLTARRRGLRLEARQRPFHELVKQRY